MAEYKIRFTQVRPRIYAPRWGCEAPIAPAARQQKGQLTLKDLLRAEWEWYSRHCCTRTFKKGPDRDLATIEIIKSRSKRYPGHFALMFNHERVGYFESIEAILVRLKLTGWVPLNDANNPVQGDAPK